jgi:cell division protein FtsL
VSWRATAFWSLLAALVGFGLFHVKYQVQALEDRLAKLNRAIVREQEQIHVLRAEWTYLDRPERIEELSKKYLDLAPPKPDQIGSIRQLPMRPPDAPAGTPTVAEPTKQSTGKSTPANRPKIPPGVMTPVPIAEEYRSITPTPVAVRPSRADQSAERPDDAAANGNRPPALPGGGR